MKLQQLSFVLVPILFVFSTACAQVSEEQIQEIDKLFAAWDSPNQPGGAVGIMKNGELVYSKAFGLSSLEYKIPNTYGTQFNIASVSKQFTSMGILKLEAAGKLRIEDDLRKHLPELPDFGHTITLKHCMHHTSGMRSLHAMLGMAGWRDDDSRSDEDLWRFMKRQKDLNFAPGDDNLYCNTGYMLLARVIEKISGTSFPDWMKKEVFEPLGMNHTYVEDEYSRVVPNNATSYYFDNEEGKYYRAVEYWGYVGSGNMHSTIEDLLAWQSNFTQPKSGWEGLFEELQVEGSLNNGNGIGYALGLSIGNFKGHSWVGHGGAIGGFRSNITTFADQDLHIAVLGNFNQSNPGGKLFDIADILLEDEREEEAAGAILKVAAIKTSSRKLKKYEGLYWNLKENYSRKIYLKDDTLRYWRREGNETALLPIAENSFQMQGLPFEAFVAFEKNASGTWDLVFTQPNQQVTERFESYEKPTISEKMLNAFVGKYYSPELDSYYTIDLAGESLQGYHVRHGAFTLKVHRENYLEASLGMFGALKIKRDESGQVLGLYASNGRVRNLWFEKL